MLQVWRLFDLASPRDFAALWTTHSRDASYVHLWEDLEALQNSGMLDVCLGTAAQQSDTRHVIPVRVSELTIEAREAAFALTVDIDSEVFLSLSDPAEQACSEWFRSWDRENDDQDTERALIGWDVAQTVREFRELTAARRDPDPAVIRRLKAYGDSRKKFVPFEVVPLDAITVLASARLSAEPKQVVAIRLADALSWGQREAFIRERFLMSNGWPELLARNYFLG